MNYELDQFDNRIIKIPRGWRPRCAPQDKRKRHDVRKTLESMRAALARK